MVEVFKVQNVYGQNLDECYLDSDGFYFQKVDDDKLYFIAHNSSDIKMVCQTKSRIQNFYNADGKLFFSDMDSKVTQLKEPGRVKILFHEFYSPLRNSINSEFILGYKMSDYKITEKDVLNIISEEKVLSYEGIIKMIYKNYLLFHDGVSITCKKINNNEIYDIWKFRFKDAMENTIFKSDNLDYKLERFLGITNGIIWISFDSERILGMDINSGKVFFDLHDILNVHYTSNGNRIKFNLKDYLVIDHERNLLIGLVGKSYFEVSFENGKPLIKNVDFSEELAKFQPFFFDQNQIGYLPICNGRLVGVDKMNGKICLIDLNKLRIIFFYDLEIKEISSGKIISSVWLSNNQIYITDLMNTLTIIKFDENFEN